MLTTMNGPTADVKLWFSKTAQPGTWQLVPRVQAFWMDEKTQSFGWERIVSSAEKAIHEDLQITNKALRDLPCSLVVRVKKILTLVTLHASGGCTTVDGTFVYDINTPRNDKAVDYVPSLVVREYLVATKVVVSSVKDAESKEQYKEFYI